MKVAAVVLVGKLNEPLFYHGTGGEEESGSGSGGGYPSAESLGRQMAAHSALDIVEERRRKAAGAAPSSSDLYFGQLLQVDEYKVFGHYSNTHTKTLVVCDSATEAGDASVRELVLALRGLYTTATQNPFQSLEKPFTSTKFRKAVAQLCHSFNLKANR